MVASGPRLLAQNVGATAFTHQFDAQLQATSSSIAISWHVPGLSINVGLAAPHTSTPPPARLFKYTQTHGVYTPGSCSLATHIACFDQLACCWSTGRLRTLVCDGHVDRHARAHWPRLAASVQHMTMRCCDAARAERTGTQHGGAATDAQRRGDRMRGAAGAAQKVQRKSCCISSTHIEAHFEPRDYVG